MTAAVDRLLALTDEVQAAISAGHWRKAAQLEAQRSTLLQAYLSSERAANGNVAHLNTVLNDLHARNNRMIGEVHHHRRLLSHKVAELDRGKKAVAAYGEIDLGATRY